MSLSTLESLQAQLDTIQYDQLRIIADWLEDGDELAMAHAYRWMAHNKMAPRKQGRCYQWRPLHATKMAAGDQLPTEAAVAMQGTSREKGDYLAWNQFKTISSAYHWAAIALVLSGLELTMRT